MANTKKTRKTGSSDSRTQKKPAAKKREKSVEARNPDSLRNQLIPCLLFLCALLIVICLVWSDNGWLGNYIKPVLYGLFSFAAIAVPVLLCVLALFWKRSVRDGVLPSRIVFAILCVVMFCVVSYAIGYYPKNQEFSVSAFWEAGRQWKGGGIIGDVLGWALCRLVGAPCTAVVSIAALLLFVMLLAGATPHSIYVFCAFHWKRHREKMAADRESRDEEYRREMERQKYHPIRTEPQAEQPTAVPPRRGRHRADPADEVVDDMPAPADNADADVESVGTDAETEEVILPTVTLRGQTQPDLASAVANGADSANGAEGVEKNVLRPEETPRLRRRPVDAAFAGEGEAQNGEITDIFSEENPISEEILRRFVLGKQEGDAETQSGSVDLGDPSAAEEEGLAVERSAAVPEAVPAEVKKPEPPPYQFPPISLLNQGTQPSNSDISEELQTTAKKLVDTLRSFKVRTRIVNVSRGPTITRYELSPEEGIRVRSILNLVDDISLNLATSGVRIEAPIPGKQAVGIEVPNRTVETVYLRRLIENPQFSQSASRITVSLGEDVAGAPVYLDIAKMPHLLIAGATGMGKSVCINSMIVSLLYKASPDEVKLILIDPKKVELNIYNGLPHLLVPVVSDPKKAAGSLQWAVTEMERRFTLIEEVGVRDLKTYNQVTKDDPEKEFLPQIIIIIDELADLMMTAPDDVEESVCRLAQKARAAGMHLIIGTQRPSVDVITGLIKANIPSRIAFTVASQVDSRTILDITGAEKLIGRGDMLYAPVGCVKPIRVQGAFVSEKEIESILDFIGKSHGQGVYNEEVIASIEREAARCGQSHKGGDDAGGGDDGEVDPMLYDAIELALQSGKISTSLIQRRLSLGYGRAAKLIDAMERRGIVSAPDGQKPRQVLITQQQYMEMRLKGGDLDE